MTPGDHYGAPPQQDDNVLLRRYRLHEMASEEAEGFEPRLFNEPALCEALEIDGMLAEGFRALSAYDGPSAPAPSCSEQLSPLAGA